MAYTDKKGRVWHELDATSLPKDGAEAYEAYREANRFAAEAKAAFEAVMSKHMPNVAFGYNFGKLSFTEDAKPASPKAAPMSLKDWLASKRASGHRT